MKATSGPEEPVDMVRASYRDIIARASGKSSTTSVEVSDEKQVGNELARKSAPLRAHATG